MSNKVWDEIIHPFSSLNSYTIDVSELISNFIPHILISLSILQLNLSILVKEEFIYLDFI